MKLLFVIKPYAIDVYAEETKRILLGQKDFTRIEGEVEKDYEQRMIYVAKEVALDVKKHIKQIEGIQVILCYPWCTYDYIDIKKDFVKETSVTSRLLESLKIQKQEENVILFESEISHVLLNGYAVRDFNKHKARELEMQVLNVYTRASLYNPLKNMLETIFHTHTISVTSVYSFALKIKPKNGLTVLLEEESVDISFASEGKVLLNAFIPSSYKQLEHELATILDTDVKTVRNILSSKSNQVAPLSKSMRHIWPDLHLDIKKKVEDKLNEHYKMILKYIYTLLDQIKKEHAFKAEEIHICAINNTLGSVYGLGLTSIIKNDQYIKDLLQLEETSVCIDYLF